MLENTLISQNNQLPNDPPTAETTPAISPTQNLPPMPSSNIPPQPPALSTPSNPAPSPQSKPWYKTHKVIWFILSQLLAALIGLIVSVGLFLLSFSAFSFESEITTYLLRPLNYLTYTAPYFVALIINHFFWRKRLQIKAKYWATLISLTQIIFIPLTFIATTYGFILYFQITNPEYRLLQKKANQAESNYKTDNFSQNNELITNDSIDTDGDGLSNVEEQRYGTNPENGDTDGDGLSDFEESQISNPLIPDSDADGLSDYEELKVYYTKPLAVDTDDDGYKDGDEVKNGYNPLGAGKLQQLQ